MHFDDFIVIMLYATDSKTGYSDALTQKVTAIYAQPLANCQLQVGLRISVGTFELEKRQNGCVLCVLDNDMLRAGPLKDIISGKNIK
jgi:hypothetical protein